MRRLKSRRPEGRSEAVDAAGNEYYAESKAARASNDGSELPVSVPMTRREGERAMRGMRAVNVGRRPIGTVAVGLRAGSRQWHGGR